MAEPKKRTNSSKQGMRRMHDHTKQANIVYCESCHEPKEAHKVCYSCGNFDKKPVLEMKKEK
ncbi:MAG: 50S ribosomal protein L32 [Candidatus Berkelbacteria bacterium]|nr:50S ribosomal protein L32 [Candidatus Berkelbacteria bacterium]